MCTLLYFNIYMYMYPRVMIMFRGSTFQRLVTANTYYFAFKVVNETSFQCHKLDVSSHY